jgi:DNA-binding LacI/PurR family transcriptional regulator
MTSTSRDVARAAGVSVATVSRAFSEAGAVSEGTRRRVLTEARRLGYSPNPAARRLITGRWGNIGLIVPDLTNPFFADIMKGVQRSAREARHAILMADTDEQPRLEADALRNLARQVDGVILASPRSPIEELPSDLGIPIVLIHRQAPGWWSVTASMGEGARQALVNLRALGHTKVAYAGGPSQSWSGRMRSESLHLHAPELGVELYELGTVAPTIDGGLVAADLTLATPATALIAYNDVVALGAMRRFSIRGVLVPDDMSVIGFDNTMLSQLATPALTTVDVPRFEAGEAAVALLGRQMTDPDADPIEQVLLTALVIRGTTVPPRQS